ncbi:WD repeat-containing protein 44, partial [Coemansia sp. BCRC 34301]
MGASQNDINSTGVGSDSRGKPVPSTLQVPTTRSGTHTSEGSGSSPSGGSRLHLRDGSHPVTRTPSAVEFPGAFTTRPRRLDKTQQDSVDRVSIVPTVMKSRVTEAVSGSLANVVGGVYNIVNYVNPLGGSARDSKAPTPAKSDDSGGAELAAQSNLPHTPDSLIAGEPMVMQVPSAGTSVAADLDEHCLADANADNPESNRPPTPTKKMFSRMLRFPAADGTLAADADGSGGGDGSGEGASGKARGNPVSRNVAQRTGLQFRPGAEERRRYMRRVSKAPQLDAPAAVDAAGLRRRSASADVAEAAAEVSSSGSSSDATDDEDGDAIDAADGYQAAAASQRSDSKTRAVDAWRFITPRTKRVKRRVLWRVFLAQEISPAVYDEASAASPAGKQAVSSLRRGVGTGASSAAKGSAGSAVWAMEFSVCGRYLAAGGQDGVVRIWRILAYAREQANAAAATSAFSAAASPPPMQQQPSSAGSDPAPFANSAPVAKGGSGPGSKHARSFSTGQPAPAHLPDQLLGGDLGQQQQQQQQQQLHSGPVQNLHPMHAYELLEPVPFRSYVGHSADVLSLSWSKNGFLLSASADRTVRLWHPHRPECLCTFRHRDIVTSVAFSPRDDRLFISGSLDCRLRLWDIPARGVRHWTKLPDAQMVTAVAFTSPRADRIVAGT